MPYTEVTVSGYNSSPPPDDGTQVAANEVTWAGIKTKIGDPLKTAIETTQTNITTVVSDELQANLYAPTGTAAVFAQTAAPTLWTKATTHDDKALRVVTGAASSGGATAFTSVFGSGKTTGAHTLTSADIPAHTHSFSATTGAGSAHSHSISITSGAGSAHSHSISITSGNNSVSHTHSYSGTTSGGSAHSHGVTDPGHDHGNNSSANNGAINVASGNQTSVADNGGVADTDPAFTGISIDNESAHTHTYSGTTGNNSVTHTHSVSGTSASESAHTHSVSGTSASESSHTHSVSGTSGSTGSGGSHTHTLSLDLQYVDVIIATKDA